MVTKKYKITKIKDPECRRLHRIRALKSFSDVHKGDLGGFIETKSNLSEEGCCWIYDNAKVYGEATVTENAQISESAEIFGNAKIYGHCSIFGNTKIFSRAEVFDRANVYGNTEIYGSAKIHGSAIIDNYAKVYENADIFEHAHISGHAWINDKAKISESVLIQYGFCGFDCNNPDNLIKVIGCSLNVYPDNDNNYILYKRVKKYSGQYCSIYDSDFIYKIGETAEVKNPDMSHESCATGIHVAGPNYWNEGNCLLQVKVNLADVITCQDGKIRCKKVTVLREVL